MTNETTQRTESDELEARIKQLSIELEQTHQDLLKQEYEGGMAEMSVGVLHNIGNTLTPSKIAISLLLQRLRDSPIRKHIKNILQPLEKVIPESNLSENEKQKLLKVIQLLPDSLEEEYELNLEDIQNISDKQEHIASIIALHMRYSHLKADYCEVNISRIISDAISIQSESISKRKIKIVTELNDIPLIKIQESKLLQILVNLLKNAYEAIDLNPKSDKLISLQCFVEELHGNSRLVIKIKDTGIGFKQGDEQHFFDFGYTSKPEGTGFGLHFCAHFIKSIGGEIKAYSDGEDKGAEFSIYLPV